MVSSMPRRGLGGLRDVLGGGGAQAIRGVLTFFFFQIQAALAPFRPAVPAVLRALSPLLFSSAPSPARRISKFL
jgi:hypothetical protein